MPENRFLQTLATVSASSVLVCGTLLLLTSTAPWPGAPIGTEPSTPDAARLAHIAVEIETATASLASDQADATADDADGLSGAPVPSEFRMLPEPVALAETQDADPLSPAAPGVETLSPAEQQFVALGSPLNAESSDQVDDVPPAASELSDAPAAIAIAVQSPVELAAAALPPPERPVMLASAKAATDQIADLLNALQAREIASDTATAAAEQVGDLLAGLPPAPPRVIASEKTGTATAEVADAAAALAPAPAGPEPKPAAEVALAPALPPPPLPRRKPEIAPAPNEVDIAAPEVAAPVETAQAPKVAVAAPRERPAPQPQPSQQSAGQPGSLFALFNNGAKPMALAPADEPPATASRPATARPSSGAYASQVWGRLARAKPRAGQRGSASVAFAISANGSVGAVRIARSSGNTRIDQLAMQTVRSAAPFPPPPSGSASHTIRIDF